MATKQEIKMISCFYPKTFSHTILYAYRAPLLLIQKKCAAVTLKLPVFGCEQVQPLSLNLMPTLALSEPLVLSYILFLLLQEQPLSHTMQNKAPVPTSTSSKAPRFTRKVSRPKAIFHARRKRQRLCKVWFYERRLCGHQCNTGSRVKAET